MTDRSFPSRIRARRHRGLTIASCLLVLICGARLAASAESPDRYLVLGPLPRPAQPVEEERLAPHIEIIPEIDPLLARPLPGQAIKLSPGVNRSWATREASPETGLTLSEPGVHWIATCLWLDRWATVSLELTGKGELEIYTDGTIDGGLNVDDDPIDFDFDFHRGWHRLLIRLAVIEGEGRLRIVASSTPDAGIRFSPTCPQTLALLDDARFLPSIGSVVVSPDGGLVARKLTRRDPAGTKSRSSIALLTPRGERRLHDIGGKSATPLAFSPDGKHLLLRTRGNNETDVVLYDLEGSKCRTVLPDEEGFQTARFSPDGDFLLVVSSRHASFDEAEDEAPRRRLHLREGVTDFTVEPHLHLVHARTGARSRLTAPGDFVLDDATFSADGKSVLYSRTVPRKGRPYFHSEIRALDLTTRKDRLVSTFVAGWEVRPQKLAPSPDGRRLAFLGPPGEVGEGRPEHNVYHYQLYLLDLDSGEWQRISKSIPYTFGAGGGATLFWEGPDALIASVQDSSSVRIARIRQQEGVWTARLLPQEGEVVRNLAVSRDGSAAAFVQSSRTTPDTLVRMNLPDGSATILERPASTPVASWTFSVPEDVPFTGPGGELLDAWWYPPLVDVDPEKTPLVVYYYGGSSPTSRSLTPLHQMFAANGYGVLVINPRGATGRGEEFADHHVKDWGPKAAADVLAGIDAFLSGHPDVDGERIGIYGGSYGGFLTQYLVSVSDRFAAAVSLYGISDLTTYWGQGVWGWTYGDMSVGGAVPWKEPGFFVEHSPLFRADRIKTPLLLLHGLEDDNVTPGESLQMFTALRMQNRDAELVLFPGENHGLRSNFAKRIEHRTMILEWFDKHLRGQEEAWDARFD